jgi:2-hydroxychromene-2-carboxylate isomerase
MASMRRCAWQARRWTAVWAQERDIASPPVLAELLAECGLPASTPGRLASCGRAAALRREHAGRHRPGPVRSPSYVVDGELFWGQDRLDFVQRKLQS